MSSLSIAGRIALTRIIYSQPLHLAWGLGDGAWTSTVPQATGQETALLSEVGRRSPSQIAYVTPDPAGAIVLPEGSYSLSVVPTRHLYIRTDFDFTEASGSAIREIGMFAQTVTQAGLPAGQKYFTPDQVTNPGWLIHLRNYAPIYRFPDTRERFEFVMTF